MHKSSKVLFLISQTVFFIHESPSLHLIYKSKVFKENLITLLLTQYIAKRRMWVPNAKYKSFLAIAKPVANNGHSARPPRGLGDSSTGLEYDVRI